uniref:SFRICE_006220 n=1 Tax=Spodoptera frugiperda TaxID=7108 RepID=A0A2H1V8R5_SPOFR
MLFASINSYNCVHRTDRIIGNAYMRCVLMTSYGTRAMRTMRVCGEANSQTPHTRVKFQSSASLPNNSWAESPPGMITSPEASLSQLVLDETDAPQSRTIGSSVWKHDPIFPSAPTYIWRKKASTQLKCLDLIAIARVAALIS